MFSIGHQFLRGVTAIVVTGLLANAQAQPRAYESTSQILENFDSSVQPIRDMKLTVISPVKDISRPVIGSAGAPETFRTYPQGFFLDQSDNALYVVRYDAGHPFNCIVEEYNWQSKKLIQTYRLNQPQRTVSEGIVVKKEGGKKFVYLRSSNNLARFEMRENAPGIGQAVMVDSVASNVAQSFYAKEGRWYVEKLKTKSDGVGQSRGDYAIYDSEFRVVGDVSFDPKYSGYRNSDKNGLPKHQGFAVSDEGYVMSMGGYWGQGKRSSPYNYFGINVFDRSGRIVKSKYMSPQDFMKELDRKGISPSSIENEGVQVLDSGHLLLLQVVRPQGKSGVELVFVEVDPSKF